MVGDVCTLGFDAENLGDSSDPTCSHSLSPTLAARCLSCSGILFVAAAAVGAAVAPCLRVGPESRGEEEETPQHLGCCC